MPAEAGSQPQNAVLREGSSEIAKKLRERLSKRYASFDLLRNLLRRYRDLGCASFVLVRDERPVGKAKLHDIATRVLLQRRHCRKGTLGLWRQFHRLNGNFLRLRKAAGCILHLDNRKDVRHGLRRAIQNGTTDGDGLPVDFMHK